MNYEPQKWVCTKKDCEHFGEDVVAEGATRVYCVSCREDLALQATVPEDSAKAAKPMSDSLLLEDERRIEESLAALTPGTRGWADDMALLLSRLKAEREKNAKISAKMYTAPDIAARGIVQYLKRACDQRDSAAAERDEAVGQVAVLREALQSVTNYFWGTEPPVLKEGDVQAEVEEALASSAPLVAAYKAEIEAGALEEAADDFQSVRLVCYASGEPIPDLVNALRARAQEKRKAGEFARFA